MKTWQKWFSGAVFASLFAAFLFVTSKEYRIIQDIPKKYLLEGELEASDDTFDFYKLSGDYDGKYAVSLKDGVTTKNNEVITIPSQYKAADDVIGIYRNGFSNLTNIKVDIPSSIKVIDYEAFMNTTFKDDSSKNFRIPMTVEKLGTASFFNTNIINLYFTDAVAADPGVCNVTPAAANEETSSTNTPKITEIPDYCFAKCKNLKSIAFPGSLTSIGDDAFEYCTTIDMVALMSGTTHLGSKAFSNCTSLKNVYIPKTLVDVNASIGDYPFTYCNSDLQIQISGDNNAIEAFKNHHPTINRKNDFFTSEYKEISSQNNDVAADGSWLYNLQDYTKYDDDETKTTSVNLLKYVGEIDSNTGILSCPNNIGIYPVTSISQNALDAVAANIKQIYLPVHLSRIEDNFFSKFTNKGFNYIGTMNTDNNCYTPTTETNVIDLENLDELTTIGTDIIFGGDFRNNVTKIKLPCNLESIGNDAFREEKNVTSLTFKEGRTNTDDFKIGDGAFKQLGQKSNGDNASIDLILPGETTRIGTSAFDSSNVIKSLTIKKDTRTDPENLVIDTAAFYNCIGLEKVHIEERASVTLNSKAFDNWAGERDYLYRPTLQYVYLPANTTLVDNTTPKSCIFDRWNRLTIYCGGDKIINSNLIGLGVEDMIASGVSNPKNFFNQSSVGYPNTGGSDTILHQSTYTYFGFNCPANVHYNIFPDSDSAGDNGKFVYDTDEFTYILDKKNKTGMVSKYHFDMRKTSNNTGISVTVPTKIIEDYTITEIGDHAFANDDACDKNGNNYRTISKVILPDTIERIGDYALFRCVGLHTVTTKEEESEESVLPDKLNEIGEHAFSLSGIKNISNLSSTCNLSSVTEIHNSSPFMNCPNLASITLKKNSGGKLSSNNKCLLYETNVLVVFPGYKPTKDSTDSTTDASFRIEKKFHYGAFRGVSWITDLTLSTSNFPTYTDSKNPKDTPVIIPQALFTGYSSEEKIRINYRYKGRINNKADGLSNDVTLETLRLQLGSDSKTLEVPEGALTKTTVKKIIIPYGKGNGTIPSKLLANITPFEDKDNDNKKTLIIQVQKSNLTDYTNTMNESGFLDLTDCGYTTIADDAFNGLSVLTKVDLTGITSIGANAFNGSGLTGTLGTASTDNIIDSSLTTIGAGAFQSCGLTSITLPENVTSLGSNVFASNSSLTAANLIACKNLTEIPESAFDRDQNLTAVSLPSSITTIGKATFHECGLTKFTVSASVTSIGNYAFQNSKLESLTFQSSSEKVSLGEGAFQNCAFTELTFNRSVDIGNSCFTGNSNLTKITFSDNNLDITIETSAFANLNLTTIDFGNSITSIGDNAFQGTSITSADLSKCSKLTSLSGFNSCTKLTSVLLPDSITMIGDNCFNGCTNLLKIGVSNDQNSLSDGIVILPGNVTSIGTHAFASCEKITKIQCTNSNLKIGYSAFANCTSLTHFIVLSTNGNFTYGENLFNGCKSLQYIVLPSNFDTNSSISLVNGLTQFSDKGTGYICIDKPSESYTNTPGWAKINDTDIAKRAWSEKSPGASDDTKTWELKNNQLDIEITSNNSTNNQNMSLYLPMEFYIYNRFRYSIL